MSGGSSGSKALSLLPPHVRRLVESRFKELTPPQEEAIPLILRGEDVLIVAPTGTGKTEAAVLPIISRIEGKGGVEVLYVTPLRALNRDLLDRLSWWFSKLDLRVAVRHGDTPPRERRAQALSPPDVLVTTPETLQLLLVGRRLREGLRRVRWVVIDEVHELADDKRGVQLAILLERVRRLAADIPQFIGLSATLGNPEEVGRLVTGTARSPRVVYVPVAKAFEVSVEWPDVTDADERLAETLFVSPEVAAKLRRIRELVESHGVTLIFTNTRPAAEMIGSRLRLWDEKFPVYVHHGSLSLGERVRVEEMLKRGELKGVVCTSSLELGIDIGHVDLVVQYGSPREVRRLVQRIGRSGHRIGEVSKGVMIVSNSDDALEAAVLCKFLREEQIEPAETPQWPLDVMVHELVGMAIAGGYTVDDAFDVLRSTLPYRDLDREVFGGVLEFAEQLGLLRVDSSGTLRPGPRAFRYFYGVLSMIPETRQYDVVEESTGERVGILDDFFVAEYCEPGARFIMAGRPWTVVSVGESEVVVRPAEDYLGAVPSWVGEEIPVPYEVALEVGRVRRLAEELALRGASLDDVAAEASKVLKAPKDLLAKALRPVYEMARRGIPVPSDRRIVVESFGELVIVHSHFGTRVNRALGKYLAHYLSTRYGLPVYISEKPYRVVVRAPGLSAEAVTEALRMVTPEALSEGVRRAVEGSRGFKWRLQQVARRMGVIEPGTTLEPGAVDKLVIALKGTPAYTEALKESLYRDMDLARAREVASMIAEGRIEVVSVEGPTSLAEEHFRYYAEYLEPSAPERRDLLRFMLFKARLYSSFVTLACMDCREYVEEVPLHAVDDKPRCPLCGSTRIAASRLPQREVDARLASGRKLRSLLASAALVRRWGRPAALLIGAGLRPYEARRVLERVGRNEEACVRAAWAHLRERAARPRKAPRP